MNPEEDPEEHLSHEGLIVHKSRGASQINPLVEAALIERAQFDGDMPELRTGPLPEGVKPSVSVDTDATDPVVLGLMMTRASEKVETEIEGTKAQYHLFLEQVAEEQSTALVEMQKMGLTLPQFQDLVFSGHFAGFDVASYKRGEVPAPIKTAVPTGSEILALDTDTRKNMSWYFLSSTQGRRTGAAILLSKLTEALTQAGFCVEARSPKTDATETVVAQSVWTINAFGPGALNPTFNVLDTVTLILSKRLMQQIGPRPSKIILEIAPVNQADTRNWGWGARLLSTNKALEGHDGQGLDL